MKLIYNKNSFLTLIKNLIFVNLAFQFNRKSYIEKPHYFLLTKTLTITKKQYYGLGYKLSSYIRKTNKRLVF
ncbi:hypothetical protein TASCI_10121 [Tenacibaculum ascidiaceicola]